MIVIRVHSGEIIMRLCGVRGRGRGQLVVIREAGPASVQGAAGGLLVRGARVKRAVRAGEAVILEFLLD